KMIEFIAKENFESQVAKGAAWIGTPDDIRNAIAAYHAQVDGFESASLQVNFGMISLADRGALDEIVRAGGDAALPRPGGRTCIAPRLNDWQEEHSRAAQHRSHSHHPCRQLDQAAATDRVLAIHRR